LKAVRSPFTRVLDVRFESATVGAVARARVLAVVVGLGLGALSHDLAAGPAPRRAFDVAPLSRDERAALSSRELVSRPFRFQRGAGSYVGGVSYQVVHADPEQVLMALASAESLPRVLPSTRSATMVSR
jgi:hypothetical protein